MTKLIQGIMSLTFLLGAGQCVSEVPTGEELFDATAMHAMNPQRAAP